MCRRHEPSILHVPSRLNSCFWYCYHNHFYYFYYYEFYKYNYYYLIVSIINLNIMLGDTSTLRSTCSTSPEMEILKQRSENKTSPKESRKQKVFFQLLTRFNTLLGDDVHIIQGAKENFFPSFSPPQHVYLRHLSLLHTQTHIEINLILCLSLFIILFLNINYFS